MTQGLFEVCPTPTGVGVYVRLSALVRDGTKAHRTATTNAKPKNLGIVMNLPRLREIKNRGPSPLSAIAAPPADRFA